MSIAVDLVNLYDGRRARARSVAAFCSVVGLDGPNDAIHIYPVVGGQRLHHKGWGLNSYFNRPVELKDIYGGRFSGTVKEALLKYKIPAMRLWNLITGKKQVLGGVMLAQTELTAIPPANFKAIHYTVETPRGGMVSGSTLSAISRQLGPAICRKSLINLKKGARDTVKGYSLSRIVVQKRGIL